MDNPPATNNRHTTTHNHPSPVTISDPNNPYPTTFVQADSTSFKKVVQMLTGSSETIKQASNSTTTPTRPEPPRNPIPLTKTNPNKKPSKLYERRNSLKNFKISPLLAGTTRNNNNNNTEVILSPSLLDFPSLVLSPVTPLLADPFNRSLSPVTDGSPNMEAEDKAIAGKGFYLHPSPVTTPRREVEPQLLTLFPLTSPRLSDSS